MADASKSNISKTVERAMPWKKGTPWWVVLIEGVVLLILGGYMFFARSQTYWIVGWVIALAITVDSAFSLATLFRREQTSQSKTWTLVHGLVGLISGLIAIGLLIFNVSIDTIGMIVLGLGCLFYGGLGVYMNLFEPYLSLRRLSIIVSIFFLVIGILLILQYFGVGTLTASIQVINFLVLVIAIVFIFWSLILRRENTPARA